MKTREAVVGALVANNMTAADLARRLGLPKQVIYYHLKVLSREGAVVVRDIVKLGGRFRAKVYGLRHGQSFVTISDPERISDTLLWLEDYYVKHLKTISNHDMDEDGLRHEFVLFMYHLMKVCSELVGINQNNLFRIYGGKLAFDILIPLTQRCSYHGEDVSFKKAAMTLNNIIDGGMSVVAGNTKTRFILIFKTFLGSGRYDSRIDEFIASCLEKIAQNFLKGRTTVKKYPHDNVRSYSYLVERTDVKKL